jgi:DNA topoisomerase-3
MRLFIAEKPSLGQAIAQCLPGKAQKHMGSKGPTHISVGNDLVTWCFGHIYELLEPQEYDESFKKWSLATLPIVPERWRLKPKKDALAQIKVIKKLIGEASEIVHAGDPDREGQLLVDEVLEELRCKKPVRRLWLNATDEKSVLKALSQLKDNRDYRNLKDSALARSWGDWLVGINATRKMTLLGQKAGIEGVLSVGRVQTPTLALIVERDQNIENFKARDFYEVRARIEAEKESFPARLKFSEDLVLDEAGRLLDKKIAEALAQKISGHSAKVEAYEAKEGLEQPPLTFSLDTLQMTCNRRLGLSAQETLNLAQELYEAKLTSYPRTDCTFLPESQFLEAAEVLSSLSKQFAAEVKGADPRRRSQVWNDKKVTAHHGIVPTGVTAELSGRKAEVYRLICLHFIAQFYPPARYMNVSTELSCQGERLVAKGSRLRELGWKAILKPDQKPEAASSDQDDQAAIPQLKVGQMLRCASAEVLAKKTTPPLRFTEASLLKAMLSVHQSETNPEIKKRLKESSGIGTPATRANILETLKKRGFIELKKSSLLSTQKGRQLISVLPQDLKSPGLTALFEEYLEGISQGRATKEDFMKKQISFVAKFIQTEVVGLKSEGTPQHPCPTCKSGHLRLRKGPKGKFWGCSNYPECRCCFDDRKMNYRAAAAQTHAKKPALSQARMNL